MTTKQFWEQAEATFADPTFADPTSFAVEHQFGICWLLSSLRDEGMLTPRVTERICAQMVARLAGIYWRQGRDPEIFAYYWSNDREGYRRRADFCRRMAHLSAYAPVSKARRK